MRAARPRSPPCWASWASPPSRPRRLCSRPPRCPPPAGAACTPGPRPTSPAPERATPSGGARPAPAGCRSSRPPPNRWRACSGPLPDPPKRPLRQEIGAGPAARGAAKECRIMNAKQSTTDLAIFGGAPAFAQPLHVGRPNVGNREKFIERVKTCSTGAGSPTAAPTCRSSRRSWPPCSGVKHCIAMCNATSALEIAIRALGLTGEVIVPSFTFIATAHCAAVAGDHPGLLRCRSAHPQHRPGPGRDADHAAHHRHHRRAPLGPALRRRRAGSTSPSATT